MISPRGMRGKGIGCADRPVVPAVPRPRRPLDSLATEKSLRFQDRSIQLGRAPGIGPMPHTGPIWLAVRGSAASPPTAPCVGWARSSRLHASSETDVSADPSFVGLAAAVPLYLFVAATSQDFVLALAASAVFFGLERMI
jgi:hypothetical protein